MLDLACTYRLWLDCISHRKWDELTSYMHPTYNYNGKEYTPTEFAAWVEREGSRFSDYRITLDTVVVDDAAQCIGCRIFGRGRPTDSMFGCTPKDQDVYFAEHHLVWFTNGKISKTIYILDIGSVRQQLQSDTQYVPDLVSDFQTTTAQLLSGRQLEKTARRFFNAIATRTTASELPEIVQAELWRDGVKMSLEAYLGLIEKSIAVMPDVKPEVYNIMSDEQTQRVFVRLELHFTPTKEMRGQTACCQTARLAEHSIYQFEGGKIIRMWTIVDWEGLRRQMAVR